MKKRILIVEDHLDFRTMVKEYLKKHKLGVDIYEASTGEMGVIKASLVKPDVVLMDINLPQANGMEAARQIKEDHPDCDLIFLTMFDVTAFKRQAEKIKARAFIAKDHVYEQLLPLIKKCLSLEGNE
jgi:DNA-binding NarL/FixJ family response regulator